MSSFGGWSRDPEGVSCVEIINLVDEIWLREGKKNAMLLVMMKQMELLTNYMKGFHSRCSQANHDYDYVYYGNQGWNNSRSVDTSSQGSNESIPPHMESTLEVVLEKVLATEEGVQDLWSKLLDLTTIDIVENDIFEWKIEEEVVGELIADVFLKGEELEEVHHVSKEIRDYLKSNRLALQLVKRRLKIVNRNSGADDDSFSHRARPQVYGSCK
ncbi:hypothetical protein HAX54_040590 [Datura stramonium]|uniref:Uncharacterized protein n=1 Tax=Datura stramonium TaxID=4076 RepID=A0ABS8VSN3_DATST|nr:hypothetical protein [Datura stramonium]